MLALRGLLLWLCLCLPVWAQDVLPIPELSDRVIDQTGTLSGSDRAALVAKLAAFEQEAGPQIVVLIVPTTLPEDHVAYAHRVADSWKIGRKDVGDGLLILVVKNDRKIRIEISKALEGAIPDLAARQIIQKQISPAFKAGDFAKGLNEGIDALQARIRGEHLPEPEPKTRDKKSSSSDGLGLEEIAALFFIGVPLVGAVMTAIFGRKLGSTLTAGGVGGLTWLLSTSILLAIAGGVVALVMVGLMGIGASRRGSFRRHDSGLPPIFWGGSGSSGGGSWGGGDGGGFSSGGGGDFGGGGASGDW